MQIFDKRDILLYITSFLDEVEVAILCSVNKVTKQIVINSRYIPLYYQIHQLSFREILNMVLKLNNLIARNCDIIAERYNLLNLIYDIKLFRKQYCTCKLSRVTSLMLLCGYSCTDILQNCAICELYNCLFRINLCRLTDADMKIYHKYRQYRHPQRTYYITHFFDTNPFNNIKIAKHAQLFTMGKRQAKIYRQPAPPKSKNKTGKIYKITNVHHVNARNKIIKTR
ncbi:MAG: hypothetical protein Faunusvirus1_13 [Faunusvirus sp.]|jgi:hypothetical protein|uniref:Uncharacterized protein n=1 Tax=Faunusvirus sp. TaxID=2487766 RepID=A0A3G4ZZI6_9VIRU|nr:MAG: hypothetical protein Faunusvirus1_13 [Faunusvirus sp.]